MAEIVISGLLETPAGKPRAGVRVMFELMASFGTATESYIEGQTVRTQTDGAGEFEVTLNVPTTGTVPYDVYVGDTSTALLTANLSADDTPLDFADILAGGYSASTDTINAMIWGNVAAATVGEDAQYATLAAALAAGEKHIALKPGTYSGAVTISQDDVKIFAYGATWTENTAAHSLTISGARVLIEGLTISGVHDGDDADMTAFNNIYITGDHATVHRCKFVNLQGYAVQVDAADYATISYCRAYNVATAASPVKYTRYCFYITNGSQRANVHHNFVTGWSQGIGFWYGTNDSTAAHNRLIDNLGHESGPARRSAMEDYGDTVQNTDNKWLYNYVDGTTSGCMELAQGLKGTLVEGNTFKGAGTGYTTNASPVFVTGGDGGASGETSDDVQIVGNRIYGANDNTVSDGCGSTGGVTGLLWKDNEFYDFLNTTATIFLQTGTGGGSSIKVTGNTFRNCGGGGHALIRSQIAGTVISDNDGVSTIASTEAIRSEASATGQTISGNVFSVTARGVYNAENCLISGNQFISSGTAVMDVQDDNTITDNVITTTASLADGENTVGGSDRNIIRGNRITRAGGTGTVMQITGTDNQITENWVEVGANIATIKLSGTSRRCVVTNNRCVRTDNALGITDDDATVSNVVHFNHTLTTLGTW